MKMDKRSELLVEGLELAEIGNYGWRKARWEAENRYHHKMSPTWDRPGLHNIAEKAIADFEEKTEVQLPYNLATHGPYVWASWNRRFPLNEEGKAIVEQTARFCGWIRAATNFPILVRLFERTTSTRGVNSPHTVVDIWEFVKRHPSPGRTARRLAQIKRRANQILEAYGLQVSWEALGNVRGLGNIGKAARKAAGYTVRTFLFRKIAYLSAEKDSQVLIMARGLKELKALNHNCALQCWAVDRVNAGEFGCFREALENSYRLTEDHTDGVHLLLDPDRTEIYHGIKSVRGWDREGRAQLFLTTGHRSFHSLYWFDLKMARKEAISAWKKQRKIEEVNREFLKTLLPTDRSFLVFINDSLDAGNCRPGTENWMRQNGLAGKLFVGVPALIKHINDIRVRRVLQVVADRINNAD